MKFNICYDEFHEHWKSNVHWYGHCQYGMIFGIPVKWKISDHFIWYNTQWANKKARPKNSSNEIKSISRKFLGTFFIFWKSNVNFYGKYSIKISWNWFIWFHKFFWPGLFKIFWPAVFLFAIFWFHQIFPKFLFAIFWFHEFF